MSLEPSTSRRRGNAFRLDPLVFCFAENGRNLQNCSFEMKSEHFGKDHQTSIVSTFK